MNFALIFIVRRVFYRIGDFFHHWYVDGSRRLFHNYINALENVDKAFAVHITFRYLFQPLYKDYSPVGRILGPIFRSGRVLIGSAFIAGWTVIFFIMYVVWILFPPALVFYSARPEVFFGNMGTLLSYVQVFLSYLFGLLIQAIRHGTA